MKKYLILLVCLIPLLAWAAGPVHLEYLGTPSNNDVPIYDSTQRIWVPGPMASSSSSGGGTEYTEDDPSDANPIGPQIMARRRDSLSTETSASGDVTALNSTAKGELYVKQTDAVPVTDNGGSLTVDGAVAATQSGTWNIGTVSTVTNVVHVDDNSSTLSVDDGGSSLTIDGTVAATQSGTWTVRNQDGSGNALTSTAGALDVNIASGASSGTQYTEGDTDASITGTAALWEDGSDTLRAISMAKPLPVQPGTSIAFPVTDNGGSLTVDNGGTFAVQASQAGTWTLGANSGVDIGDVTINNSTGASAVNVQDGGNSLTVDGSVTVTQGTGTNLHAVIDSGTVSTITNVVHVDDNSSTLSVDDGGSSLTVDGSVSVSGAVDTELTTADLDTGAGTDTRAVTGLVYGASGGGVLVSTTNPLPISDNSGSLTVDNGGTFAVQAAQSGTWTVTGAGGTFPVTDSSGSLTVDAPVGTPVFVRLSDGSSAISTLPVSLASVPSHAVTNAGTFAVQVTTQVGTANFATGQISCASTATQIAASRATRRKITIETHGTTDAFLGPSGVTTSNGLKLKGIDGAEATLGITGAIYCIVASGTQTVSYIEEYD